MPPGTKDATVLKQQEAESKGLLKIYPLTLSAH
ncbi:hypothetical protein PIIN_10608 [Serendipita indica DSM 11827]|uniref:Uncharacterized protein n=1 Tax=Serendipita indica (strain DSM 11827) TaxID=1109443 RepID=G4TZ74_SERID|nr:hypothetical protein PIIN_10608 [Serendipita indica DSM 11827]